MKSWCLACGIVISMLLIASCNKAPESSPSVAAEFDWFEYQGDDNWYDMAAESGSFHNPILAGFYPDPSIVRVDDAYYMVTSTFAWYPGIPVFRSTDLVNWTQLGHVLDRPELLPVEGLGVSRGVFAPTIRYHDGLFYVINTLVGANGNFYVTAEDPAGPWSDPVWLPGVNGIDPSLFFDDDGRVYVVNNAPPDYEQLYQGHQALWIQELDIAAGEMIGPREMIVDGGVDISTNPIWIEAPHLFKVDGWYYLIAAEGGTEFYHSEVVFRSRDPFGPYEPGPVNPILTQRTLDPGRPFPVTATGHADFVQTPAGDWWAVFLACRPYAENWYHTGRETFLHPVEWIDGWPMILDPSQAVPRVLAAPDLPTSDAGPVPLNGNFTWRDDFENEQQDLAWNSLRGPADPWLDLKSTPGVATLTPIPDALSGTATPAFLARRLQHASFSAVTSLQVPRAGGYSAGLAVFQNEQHHLYLGVRRNDHGLEVFVEQAAGAAPEELASQQLETGNAERIELRIEGDGQPFVFSVREGEGEWSIVAENVDGSILTTEVAGGFVGAYVGLHARSDQAP